MADEDFPLFTLSRADDPETSVVAPGEKDNLTKLRRMCLELFEKAGARGLTDAYLEEMEQLNGLKQTSLRKRRNDLVNQGKIVDSGRKEVPKGGTKKRIVWVLAEHGPEVPPTRKKGSSAPVFDLVPLLIEAIGFSRQTWGPHDRQKGVIQHIRKELVEIENADTPDKKLKEWIDVIILGLDGAWRSQIDDVMLSDEDLAWLIIETLVTKYAKNMRRDWPDWRTMGQDEAIEHVRGKED